MEKAASLGAMIRSFRVEPLEESQLADFFCGGTMAIRMGDEHKSPLRKLQRACATPSISNAHLLLGHRGCGKSTELVNLKRQFEKSGQPAHIIDCNIELDLFQANCWDIMLLITEGLCKIANDKDIDLPQDTTKAVFDYLKKDTEITKTEERSISAEASAGIEAGAPPLLPMVLKAFFSVKSDARLSAGTRAVTKEKLEKRASEWLDHTKIIASTISERCGGQQPVIIFEGLDKIPIPSNIFNILQFAALAQMPFPVVYTFPMSQFYSPQFSSIRDSYARHILPMIKVSNIDRTENSGGIAVIREIVGKRADLALFDGEAGNGALEHLIKKTGGSLRHLFECIISAAERADSRSAGKIQREDADSALSDLRSELTRLIAYPDYKSLVNIYSNKNQREQIADSDLLLRMMQASVVIEYQNGERWHDLHPLIADFLIRQGEIIER